MGSFLSIFTFALLNIYKKEGHLNQVTRNKFSTSTGEIFLSSMVYGFICLLCLIVPITIGVIFILLNPLLGGIVCALFLIPFLILSEFGYFRMLWHDPNNEGILQTYQICLEIDEGQLAEHPCILLRLISYNRHRRFWSATHYLCCGNRVFQQEIRH